MGTGNQKKQKRRRNQTEISLIRENAMIVKLEIENFRGIEKLQFDELKNINLFVGKNNSGKTTVLESIFLNIGATIPELAPRTNVFRDHNKIDDPTFRAFFHDFDILKPIKITSSVKSPVQYRELKITPNYSSRKSEEIINLKEIESNENTSLKPQEIIGLTSELSYKDSAKSKLKTYKSYIVSTPNGLEITRPQNYNETLRGIYISPRRFASDNAIRLSKIKLMKKEDQITKILQKIEPKLNRIEILENNYIYADIGKANLIPFALLGDGINRLLTIILAVFENENGVVLIDEIENGFHYEAMENLWRAIVSIAQEHNVQIFATTHSWENIMAFSAVYTEMKYNDLMLYRIESKDKLNNAVKYDSKILLQTLENEWELR